jgi:hypothetical protein
MFTSMWTGIAWVHVCCVQNKITIPRQERDSSDGQRQG